MINLHDVIEAYKRNGGNKAAAAREMGVARSTFGGRLNKALRLYGETEESAMNFDAQQKDLIDALELQVEKLKGKLRRERRTELSGSLESLIASRIISAPVEEYHGEIPTIEDAIGNPVCCAVLSDIHYGEVVDGSEIEHLNRYDKSIAELRVMNFFAALGDMRNKHRTQSLVLMLGGDMLSGRIHDELIATNDVDSMEGVLDLSSMIIKGIKHLEDIYSDIMVVCVAGNHSRITEARPSKKYNKQNFDWLLYKIIEREMTSAGCKSKFYIPESINALFSVHDTSIFFTHGDSFSGSSIAGPYGVLMRESAKREKLLTAKVDLSICCHYHTLIPSRRHMVNGSIIGYNEYAYRGGFSYDLPAQLVFLIEPRYGVTTIDPIFL